MDESVLLIDATGRLAGWTAAAAAALEAAGLSPALGQPAEEVAAVFSAVALREVPLSGGGSLRWLPAAGSGAFGGGAAGRLLAGRLLAAASHDLRQPLAALSLLTGVLDERAGDPSTRDLLRSMAAAVRSLKMKLDAHLDLARLEAGLLPVETGMHAVNGILTRLGLDFAPRFAACGVRFSVHPCSALVRTDPLVLERIVDALLATALLHASGGRVVLGCRLRGPELRIEVWCGPAAAVPARLRALAGLFGGADGGLRGEELGLDLILARSLAHRLGHRVQALGGAAAGTALAVLVPRVGEPATGRRPPAAAPAAPGLSGARVLVVEDDPLVLAALDLLLRQWGCTAVLAQSFETALERLGPAPEAPDLIVADLRLKGSANGIATIRRLGLTLGTAVPGLILTGDTDPLRLREAALSGYPLLHKPVAPLALRAAMARLLRRGPSRTQPSFMETSTSASKGTDR